MTGDVYSEPSATETSVEDLMASFMKLNQNWIETGPKLDQDWIATIRVFACNI